METKTEAYQGWKNYETWAVKLWLDNDEAGQGLQADLLKQAQDTPKNKYWTREETTRFTLADLLKEAMTDANPLNDTATVWTDLLNSALENVDWHEIAENIIEADKADRMFTEAEPSH